jgi:hypothetical protein
VNSRIPGARDHARRSLGARELPCVESANSPRNLSSCLGDGNNGPADRAGKRRRFSASRLDGVGRREEPGGVMRTSPRELGFRTHERVRSLIQHPPVRLAAAWTPARSVNTSCERWGERVLYASCSARPSTGPSSGLAWSTEPEAVCSSRPLPVQVFRDHHTAECAERVVSGCHSRPMRCIARLSHQARVQTVSVRRTQL